MKNFFKVSVLALFAGALLFSGASAVFAEATVYGDWSASMGLANYDGGDGVNARDTTEYISGHESNLWWKGGEGPLTARVRIRLRGGDERSCCGSSISGGETSRTVSALRGVGVWKPTKMVHIYFHGRALGIPGQKNTAKVLNVRNEFSNDDVDDDVSVLNVPGLGVVINAGGFVAGFHLMSACKPSCLAGGTNRSVRGINSRNNSGGRRGGDISEDSTTVLHVSGKGGPVKFHVQLTSSEGTIDDTNGAVPAQTELSLEGNSLWAGAELNFGIIKIGLEFSQLDFIADDTSGVNAGSGILEGVREDTNTAIAVKFKFGLGISFYTRDEDLDGKTEFEYQSIDITYKIKVSKLGHLSIELRTVDTSEAGAGVAGAADERSHNIILFGAKTKF